MIIRRRPHHHHAAAPRRRVGTGAGARRRITVLAAAVPIGLVASSTLVWHSSHAAFVDTTDNPGNAWRTGVVALDGDRGATALFSTASEGLLVPGSSGHRCITVTYSGNVDTAETGVRLHGALTGSTALADALQVRVEVSATALSPAPDADCLPGLGGSPVSHAPRAFSAFPTGYGTGLGDGNGDGVADWRPTATGNRSRTYRISYSLPAGSYPDTLQGQQVGMTFTWEVRSDDTPGT